MSSFHLSIFIFFPIFFIFQDFENFHEYFGVFIPDSSTLLRLSVLHSYLPSSSSVLFFVPCSSLRFLPFFLPYPLTAMSSALSFAIHCPLFTHPLTFLHLPSPLPHPLLRLFFASPSPPPSPPPSCMAAPRVLFILILHALAGRRLYNSPRHPVGAPRGFGGFNHTHLSTSAHVYCWRARGDAKSSGGARRCE